jgi:replication factor C small subunit
MNNSLQYQQLFINKYRPLYLKDFDLEKDLFDIIKILIKSNKLNILFVGTTGSCKTTILNAIIREYYTNNSQSSLVEYNENNYLNCVLHINNLKEQGINYYRNEVKTFCKTHCLIKGKKKTIILDDLDLLNEQSQQVFRNYIDKYSRNVNFLSSCNNIQKVIENIQSRLLLIKLKPLNKLNLNKIMENIKMKENINIDADAQNFVLNICNNTAKIVVNYLEKFQLITANNREENIDVELATELCTNINFKSLHDYTVYIKEKDLRCALDIIYSIFEKGYSVMDILDSYFLFVKTTNLLTETQKYEFIPIISKYITIFHTIHEDEIELALITNNFMKVV